MTNPERWQDKPNRHAYCDSEIDRRGAVLRQIQADGVARIAHDLASLLQRAYELGIAVCADVDAEGTDYSIESTHSDADVRWEPAMKCWTASVPATPAAAARVVAGQDGAP